MPNGHVESRLIGIQAQLMAAHKVGASMSASSRGREREAFVNDFLCAVLPPTYRFGSGDATGRDGGRSGQLDVVVEHPTGPSLPAVGSAVSRLYLAENIALVIEVKSNIADQWGEVLHTAKLLANARRDYHGIYAIGAHPEANIPLFAVGYTGWKKIETVRERLKDSDLVSGVLVIDEGIFQTSDKNGLWTTGPWALWGLISMMHSITNNTLSIATDPLAYAM